MEVSRLRSDGHARRGRSKVIKDSGAADDETDAERYDRRGTAEHHDRLVAGCSTAPEVPSSCIEEKPAGEAQAEDTYVKEEGTSCEGFAVETGSAELLSRKYQEDCATKPAIEELESHQDWQCHEKPGCLHQENVNGRTVVQAEAGGDDRPYQGY